MKTLNYFPKWNKITLVALSLLVINNIAFAQIKPVNAIYYADQFLMNPAMAGREIELNALLGYRTQMGNFVGAPKGQFLAIDYGFDQKSGIGLKINNDKAGLLRQTRVAATYAYHLQINREDRLSFGVSAVFNNETLNETAINGDLDDADVIAVNDRKTYLESDFGIAYRSKSLTIQGVLPNMIALFKKNGFVAADYSVFFAAASYKFNTDLGTVEPKLVYRGIKGFKNMLDFGTNLQFKSNTNNQFNILGFYHSSKSATVGFGFAFKNRYTFNGSYTVGTAQISGITMNDFEIGLGLKL